MNSSAHERGGPRIAGARRPIAALIAVLIGLGGFGFAAGTALGAASATPHVGAGHHHDDAERGPRMQP